MDSLKISESHIVFSGLYFKQMEQERLKFCTLNNVSLPILIHEDYLFLVHQWFNAYTVVMSGDYGFPVGLGCYLTNQIFPF